MSNLLTDYLLVLVIGWLALDVHRKQYLGDFLQNSAWVMSFSLFALASFLGGTYHGFLEQNGTVLSEYTWFSTIICIQLASFTLAVTIVEQFLRSTVVRRAIEGLLLTKLAVIVSWLAFYPQFIYVMVGYGMDLVVVITVLSYSMVRRRSRSTRWLFVGTFIIPVASIIQQIPLSVFGVFDQNDVYHFILIGSFVCLHRGIKQGKGTLEQTF
ncbi:MAG: hypothetical protein ABEK50_07100 [bacterium]